MTELNLPWVESPFFEEELVERSLKPKDEEDAKFYHDKGYLVLSNIFEEADITSALHDLESNLDHHFSKENPRAMNLWQQSEAVKALSTHPTVLEKLRMLYGREAIPFQTLNFKYGSQQHPHSDTIHFSSFPPRFMCGVWIALEDMDEENGTVFYYPGSHKLPIYDYSILSDQFDLSTFSKSNSFYIDRYEPFIKGLMDAHGFQLEPLRVKKGDLLIWSANLIHGGLPIKENGRTRWSQVNHYYFEDCLYFTPQLSNPPAGEWFLRKITDIRTGQTTWGSYNGHKPKRKVVPDYRYLISKYAPYSWRDAAFVFTRLYYRFFK